MQLIAVSRDSYLIKTNIQGMFFVIETTALMGFISAVLLDWAAVMQIRIPKIIFHISILTVFILMFLNNLYSEVILSNLFIVCPVIAIINIVIYARGTEGRGILTKRLFSLCSVFTVNMAIFFHDFDRAWMNALIISAIIPAVLDIMLNLIGHKSDEYEDRLDVNLRLLVSKSLTIWVFLLFVLYKNNEPVSATNLIALRALNYYSTIVMVIFPLLWRLHHDKFLYHFVLLKIATITIFFFVMFVGDYLTFIESLQYGVVAIAFSITYYYTLIKLGVR